MVVGPVNTFLILFGLILFLVVGQSSHSVQSSLIFVRSPKPPGGCYHRGIKKNVDTIPTCYTSDSLAVEYYPVKKHRERDRQDFYSGNRKAENRVGKSIKLESYASLNNTTQIGVGYSSNSFPVHGL